MSVSYAQRCHPVLIVDGPRASALRWTRFVRADQMHRNARVVELIQETADTRTLLLECMDGQPVNAKAGQYMTLSLEVEGQRHKRAYSLSRLPEGSRFAVTVKQVPNGQVSAHINQRLAVGDTLQFNGPSGDFILPEAARAAYIFAAAGSGITPVLSMIEALISDSANSRSRPEITLLYGNRRQDDIIFKQRLENLAATYPALKIIHVLSKPARGWQGERGRITADHLLENGTGSPDTHFFLCGPGSFNADIRAGLGARNIDNSRIHTEHFTQGIRESRAHPTDPHPAVFTLTSGDTREVIVRPGESLLEAGLRAGLPLQFSCTMGGCGHCKIKRVSGDIAMDAPNCLTDTENEAGQILACCAFPHGRVVVQLTEPMS